MNPRRLTTKSDSRRRAGARAEAGIYELVSVCVMRPILALELSCILIFCRIITLAPVRVWTSLLQLSIEDHVSATSELYVLPEPLWVIPGYIERLSRFVPWTNRCLPAAVATGIALRWRGQKSLLVLGARLRCASDHSSTPAVNAHAWLCVGSTIVCGRKGIYGHGVLAAWRFCVRCSDSKCGQ